MFHTGRRPMGRLCYWAPIFALGAILAWTVPLCAASPASGSLALTTVTDTVYLADGTPAQGSLILTWPAFVTPAGTAADAGNTTVKLGADGSLSVALGAERGRKSGGCLLHGGLPARPGRSQNRILAGASKFSDKPCDGSHESRFRDGGPAGVDAIPEHSARGESRRQLGRALERFGNNFRSKSFLRKHRTSRLRKTAAMW
jgi:hypothetical protein